MEDLDLYLYNKINENSVSHIFDPKETNNEEANFRSEVKHKFLSIRDYKLDSFKFLKTDSIPEFNGLDKYNFARKIASDIQLEKKGILKKDNYKLFINHAVKNKNADMLRIYVKQYLLYTSVFTTEHIEQLKLFLISYLLYSDLIDSITINVITNPEFKEQCNNLLQLLHIKGNVICEQLSKNEILNVVLNKLNIFSLKNINMFNKIIYLEPNTIFNGHFEDFLELNCENKIYSLVNNNKKKYNKLSNTVKHTHFTHDVMCINNTKIISDIFTLAQISVQKYLIHKK